MTDGARFCHLLRPPARKWIGSILSTPDPTWAQGLEPGAKTRRLSGRWPDVMKLGCIESETISCV